MSSQFTLSHILGFLAHVYVNMWATVMHQTNQVGDNRLQTTLENA